MKKYRLLSSVALMTLVSTGCQIKTSSPDGGQPAPKSDSSPVAPPPAKKNCESKTTPKLNLFETRAASLTSAALKTCATRDDIGTFFGGASDGDACQHTVTAPAKGLASGKNILAGDQLANGTNIAFVSTKKSFADAPAVCSGLGAGWKLPLSKDENANPRATAAADVRQSAEALGLYLENIKYSTFWSASSAKDNSSHAYMNDLSNYGDMFETAKTDTMLVICVEGPDTTTGGGSSSGSGTSGGGSSSGSGTSGGASPGDSGSQDECSAKTVGMTFVKIPAGTFMMGSPYLEAGHEPIEGPQHQVTISKVFEMQTTELTQSQWVSVMGSNPSNFQKSHNCPGEFTTTNSIPMCPNNPVEKVSWNDVQACISKLNAKADGYRYRLPTEAEWEYAARAGTTGADAGDHNAGGIDAMAWYTRNSGGKSHPVAKKQANAWGLFDMHGNVYEWTADLEGDYSAAQATDPVGPSEGRGRVFRGGSWWNSALGCRSAGRGIDAVDIRDLSLGFRLLRTSP